MLYNVSMSLLATALGFLYVVAAMPVTYAVVVTSAFEYSAPLEGVVDFASRGLLLLSFVSLPVLMLTAGSLLITAQSVSSLADFWPLLLPGVSVVLFATNSLIPKTQSTKKVD